MKPQTKKNKARDERRRRLKMGCIKIRRKLKRQNNGWRESCIRKVSKWDKSKQTFNGGKERQLGIACYMRKRIMMRVN